MNYYVLKIVKNNNIILYLIIFFIRKVLHYFNTYALSYDLSSKKPGLIFKFHLCRTFNDGNVTNYAQNFSINYPKKMEKKTLRKKYIC